MTYIPDYRKQALSKFDESDKSYLLGYRAAIEDAICFFDNTDVYEASEEEDKVLSEAKGCFEDWMNGQEIETVCSMAEDSKYDDLEFEDENPPLYESKSDGNEVSV